MLDHRSANIKRGQDPSVVVLPLLLLQLRRVREVEVAAPPGAAPPPAAVAAQRPAEVPGGSAVARVSRAEVSAETSVRR